MTVRALLPTAIAIVLASAGASGCGERIVELDPGVGDDGGGDDDGGARCVPGETECTDCVDNDGDGLVDGFDPECTGGKDDLEDSFGTGIAGDNSDLARQDCFFDGNSGAGGDDGCDVHVCCELVTCPANLPGPPFDPTECATPVTQECVDNCLPLAPPGCDCFGCCTVCDGPTCYDIYVQPTVAAACDQEVLDDPTKCPRCTKNDACAQPCGAADCILCPGQQPSDLPDTCTGTSCPSGQTTCATTDDCGAAQFCAAGCCIATVP